MFHFLKRFLIGLIGFCIIVNTMNILDGYLWCDPTFSTKLGKLLRHMTQNWTFFLFFYFFYIQDRILL